MLGQTITTYELIKIIGIIITMIGGIFAISRQIRSERSKFATKEYVEQELDVVDERIKAIKEEQISGKDDLKYIRKRIDHIVDNMPKK